ncbi:MAG: hypothetical protein IPL16_15445 [Ignavibacteria bacterium]|nr:hypothetical protein [Ignavibacteria bacterium]
MFYNPSGLGQMKYREVSFLFSITFWNSVSTAALTYAEPLRFGTAGLGLNLTDLNCTGRQI